MRIAERVSAAEMAVGTVAEMAVVAAEEMEEGSSPPAVDGDDPVKAFVIVIYMVLPG